MTTSVLATLTLVAFWALATGTSALACSATTPCSVAEGEYYIAMPEGTEGPVPAVVFIHGWGSSGPAVLRNAKLAQQILDRGYALIAPDGLKRQRGNGGAWSFHPDRAQRRDEVAFITAVRADAVASHGIDPDRVLLSGFSIGGSMTAYLACATPEAFSAYAPLGGNFWRPHPVDCAGPVRMLHTHGWTDGTVPLEGRILRPSDGAGAEQLAQGDVFHALRIWRETNGCDQLKADSFVTEGPYLRRKWERCTPGSALEFALFPGGHVIPGDWASMALDWYEGL
ncbi:alpha/beta hydrolase family esterase [Tropicimonas sp. S265A]|uniref:alpha/beta hydrolase family esterase n=1 Tax=Tropicimonas sp. S265A TaxID=3415134 RepID=UPI003C7D1E76